MPPVQFPSSPAVQFCRLVRIFTVSHALRCAERAIGRFLKVNFRGALVVALGKDTGLGKYRGRVIDGGSRGTVPMLPRRNCHNVNISFTCPLAHSTKVQMIGMDHLRQTLSKNAECRLFTTSRTNSKLCFNTSVTDTGTADMDNPINTSQKSRVWAAYHQPN